LPAQSNTPLKGPGKSAKSYLIRKGRLHPVWRASLYLVAYLVLAFAAQFALVSAWLTLNLFQGQSVEEVLSYTQANLMSLPVLLASSVIQAVLVIGLTVFFRRVIDRRPFRELGFETPTGWISEVLMGLALGFGAMLLIFALEWAAGLAHVRVTSASVADAAVRLGGAAAMYLAVGMTEELMFRGYLLQTLREWPGVIAAVLVTSCVFGLLHACNPNVSPVALAYLVLAGLVFAYAYLVTGRLWWPIAMHFSWNFFQGPVFGFPVSGLPADGLLVVESVGPAWLTGGDFGPEAGLVGLAALGLIAAAIWAWSRVYRMNRPDYGLPADS